MVEKRNVDAKLIGDALVFERLFEEYSELDIQSELEAFTRNQKEFLDFCIRKQNLFSKKTLNRMAADTTKNSILVSSFCSAIKAYAASKQKHVSTFLEMEKTIVGLGE